MPPVGKLHRPTDWQVTPVNQILAPVNQSNDKEASGAAPSHFQQ